MLAGSGSGRKVLVLGDMGELGEETPKLHFEVGEYASQRQIDALYGLGPYTAQAVKAFGHTGIHFDDFDELLDSITKNLENDMTILVKGSRSMRMERVIEALRLSDTQGGCA